MRPPMRALAVSSESTPGPAVAPPAGCEPVFDGGFVGVAVPPAGRAVVSVAGGLVTAGLVAGGLVTAVVVVSPAAGGRTWAAAPGAAASAAATARRRLASRRRGTARCAWVIV